MNAMTTTTPWDIALQIVLFACGWVLIYHHVIYPILIKWLAERRRRADTHSSVAPLADQTWPQFTVIVPAYNEAAHIEEKIRNLAQIDYPRDKLKIIVALDGSKDATRPLAEAAIARYAKGIDLELKAFAQNRGKVAVLNEQLIACADTELVALTDASTVMAPDTLRRAAKRFADENVGVVFATYRLRSAGSEGERAYTAYQTQMRFDEATLDSPMGGHGALYFIRRRLWKPMPDDTINDDFILPMSIVANGAKGVYDRSIVGEELEETHAAQEFKRRVRIGAGNMQQAIRLWRLADPRRPWLAFAFISGKGSRPLMPFIVLLAIAITAFLARSGWAFYSALLVAELGVLVLAASVIAMRSPTVPRLLAWLGYLVEGHFASFVGSLQVLAGRRLRHWQPGNSDATP